MNETEVKKCYSSFTHNHILQSAPLLMIWHIGKKLDALAHACVFRHVLRMSCEAPAQLPIDQYFTSTDVVCWQGHPRTTFPTAIDKDLQEVSRYI